MSLLATISSCCHYSDGFVSYKSTQIVAKPFQLQKVNGFFDFFLGAKQGTTSGESSRNNSPVEIAIDSPKKERRIRYSGSYPKDFKDRYKEMRGDLDTINKVLAKGSTPAGTHVPIMLDEVLDHLGLNFTKEGTRKMRNCLSVDCTLGYGGHSTEIIKILTTLKNWKHYGIDQDAIEIVKTKERVVHAITTANPEADTDLVTRRISFHNQNFGETEELAKAEGFLGRVDIIMADLGYSSMQIDDPKRGFTFKAQGPLDMRMDPTSGETALGYLKRVDRKEIVRILEENSDEVMAVQIADCLKEEPIPTTTTELSERVRKTVKFYELKSGNASPTKEFLDSAVARTMQAIRIEVNGEFHVLEKLLDALPRLLSPGGRVVFLTFHSGLVCLSPNQRLTGIIQTCFYNTLSFFMILSKENLLFISYFISFSMYHKSLYNSFYY